MKLSSKYISLNALAIAIVVLFGSVSYYLFIRNAFNHQLDRDLHVLEQEITDFAKRNNTLPEAKVYKGSQLTLEPSGDKVMARHYSNVILFDKQQEENISYRQLEFSIMSGGKNFKVIVRKSLVETEDLIQLIFYSTLIMVIALVLSLFLLNRIFLNKLWKPFHATLKQMKQFNLSGKHSIALEKTGIDEFSELNEAVVTMIRRVEHDYNEVKSFTENASHEIQTPLAIIRSKLELLSQSGNLNRDEMLSIQSIFEATNRLSKLNQSLILLTKIDNLQFKENEEVNLGKIITDLMSNYEELIEAKQITTLLKIDGDVKLLLNESLADILISNLVTNAIKHNYNGGSLEVILDHKHLSISNSGPALIKNPNEMFERFKKDQVSSESLGLGLSIVKRICERYEYTIKYDYSDSNHVIIIYFN